MCLNLKTKDIFTVKNIAIIIFVIFILISFVSIYRSCSRFFNLPARVSKTLNKIPSPLMGEGKGEGEIPVKKSIKFFGTQKTELDIKIPPQPKPVELKITEDLKVFPSTKDTLEIRNWKLEIKKSYTLIRFHPTLHLCILTSSDIFSASSALSAVKFGLKLHFLEIWRFGTAAYLTTHGPGLGFDFALISNLSLDYCRLLNSHNFGLSLKL